MPEATQIQTTISRTKINFSPVKVGSDQFTELEALVSSGAIPESAIKEYDEDKEKGVKRVQREAAILDVTSPDFVSILTAANLSKEQAELVQELVDRHYKDFNRKLLNTGEAAVLDGLAILATPLPKRASSEPAIKVTKEMVEAAAAALKAYLVDTQAKEGLINLLDKLATQKFSVTVCRPIATKQGGTDVLDRILTILGEWAEQDGILEAHAPVLEAWIKNLDKTLKPAEDELSVDDLF